MLIGATARYIIMQSCLVLGLHFDLKRILPHVLVDPITVVQSFYKQQSKMVGQFWVEITGWTGEFVVSAERSATYIYFSGNTLTGIEVH